MQEEKTECEFSLLFLRAQRAWRALCVSRESLAYCCRAPASEPDCIPLSGVLPEGALC